jgi:hypothetical protein
MTIKDAAIQLQINYSTAKHIIKTLKTGCAQQQQDSHESKPLSESHYFKQLDGAGASQDLSPSDRNLQPYPSNGLILLNPSQGKMPSNLIPDHMLEENIEAPNSRKRAATLQVDQLERQTTRVCPQSESLAHKINLASRVLNPSQDISQPLTKRPRLSDEDSNSNELASSERNHLIGCDNVKGQSNLAH